MSTPATPAPSAPVSAITISHPSTVSATDILNIINGVVDQETPVIIQSLPTSIAPSPSTTAWIGLSEIGLSFVSTIFNAIKQLHAQRSAGS